MYIILNTIMNILKNQMILIGTYVIIILSLLWISMDLYIIVIASQWINTYLVPYNTPTRSKMGNVANLLVYLYLSFSRIHALCLSLLSVLRLTAAPFLFQIKIEWDFYTLPSMR